MRVDFAVQGHERFVVDKTRIRWNWNSQFHSRNIAMCKQVIISKSMYRTLFMLAYYPILICSIALGWRINPLQTRVLHQQ